MKNIYRYISVGAFGVLNLTARLLDRTRLLALARLLLTSGPLAGLQIIEISGAWASLRSLFPNSKSTEYQS